MAFGKTTHTVETVLTAKNNMRPGVGGNECMVDSIESYAAGYTPMFFTSEDPELTVIWVFSEETEANGGDDRLGAP